MEQSEGPFEGQELLQGQERHSEQGSESLMDSDECIWKIPLILIISKLIFALGEE